MASGIVIRPETPADHEAVRRVNLLAFRGPAEADLVTALHAAGAVVLSLLAEDAGEVVGHILFSPVTVTGDAGTTRAIGLAPMSVLPGRQREGIGSRLVRSGLELLRRAGHDAVVVVGHPDYYPRFGFVPASRFGLEWEVAGHEPAFMAVELRPGAFAGRAGVVRFRPEFAGV